MRIVDGRFLRGSKRYAPGSALRVSTEVLSAESIAQWVRTLRRWPRGRARPAWRENTGTDQASGVTVPCLVLRLAMALVGDSKKR